jgi:TctA family transporter
MNKSRLVWGIVCISIAALLGVLYFRLPPEDLMFQIGDRNMPYLPPIILGVLGIFLLITAFSSGSADEDAEKVEIIQDPDKVAMNTRLEAIGWGLFLVMLGGDSF